MVFSNTWPVTTEGSDCTGRASITYLSSMLQETATLHAETLGWGFKNLQDRNLNWVLSRQWIRMDSYPRWRDNIVVTTWPSAKGAVTWSRDYRLSKENGDTLGVATSLWFVMDRKTRRPKPAWFGRDMDLKTAERVREGDLKPLPSLREPKLTGRVKAGFYDIDVHDHVNNVRYLTWMLSGLGKGFSEKHEIRELEINFLSEGFFGDEIDILQSIEAENRGHALRRHGDGTVLCRMRTEWVDSDSGLRGSSVEAAV